MLAACLHFDDDVDDVVDEDDIMKEKLEFLHVRRALISLLTYTEIGCAKFTRIRIQGHPSNDIYGCNKEQKYSCFN